MSPTFKWLVLGTSLYLGAPALANDTGMKHHHQTGHAHHAAPGAINTGQNTGNILGFQLNQQGNYDNAARDQINDTTAKALDKSAAIDQMLAADTIAPDGWMMLKSVMANSMDDAANKQMTNAPLDNTPNAGEASNANGFDTGFQDAQVPTGASNAELQDAKTASGLSALAPNPQAGSKGSQVVDLQSSGPLVFGLGGTPMPSGGGAYGSPFPPATSKESPGSNASSNAKNAGRGSDGTNAAGTNLAASDRKNLLLAQALLQKRALEGAAKLAKSAVKAAKKKGFPDPLRDFVKRVGAALSGPVREIASLKYVADNSSEPIALPPIGGELEEDDDGANWTLVLLFLLGAVFSIAMVFAYFKRATRSRSKVHVMIPNKGEHFSIRQGSESHVFFLDVKDVRGNLIRSAGTLRPESVARAAVLPPVLAARLGAAESFDRFILNADGNFSPTDKAEGYQVFPFSVKKA